MKRKSQLQNGVTARIVMIPSIKEVRRAIACYYGLLSGIRPAKLDHSFNSAARNIRASGNEAR